MSNKETEEFFMIFFEFACLGHAAKKYFLRLDIHLVLIGVIM